MWQISVIRVMVAIVAAVTLLTALAIVQAQAPCSSCQQIQSSINQWQSNLYAAYAELDSRIQYDCLLTCARTFLEEELEAHLAIAWEDRDKAWFERKNELLDALRDVGYAISDNQIEMFNVRVDIKELQQQISHAKNEMANCESCNSE